VVEVAEVGLLLTKFTRGGTDIPTYSSQDVLPAFASVPGHKLTYLLTLRFGRRCQLVIEAGDLHPSPLVSDERGQRLHQMPAGAIDQDLRHAVAVAVDWPAPPRRAAGFQPGEDQALVPEVGC